MLLLIYLIPIAKAANRGISMLAVALVLLLIKLIVNEQPVALSPTLPSPSTIGGRLYIRRRFYITNL